MDEHPPVEAELPELPALPTVLDGSTFHSELQTINQTINLLTAPWKERIQSINRLSELASHQSAQSLPDFVQSLSQSPLVVQLSDRRSAVVKAACATIIQLSHAIKHVIENQSSKQTNKQSVNQLNNQKIIWMNLVCKWYDALTPNACVTIKVISDASVNALHQVITDIAGLDLVTDQSINQSNNQENQASDLKMQGGEPEYMLIYRLIDGSTHKHAAIRNESFKGLTTLIDRMINRTIEREQENDRVESQAIKQSILDYKTHLATNTSIKQSINQEPSSPLPFNPSINQSVHQSILFARLESALYKGSIDSDQSTRQSARKALLAFQSKWSVDRASRVINALPLINQKSLMQDQLDDQMFEGVIVGGSIKQSIKQSIRKAPKMASLKNRFKDQSINQSINQSSNPVVLQSPNASPKSSPKRQFRSALSSPVKAEISYSMGSLITPPEDMHDELNEQSNNSDSLSVALSLKNLDEPTSPSDQSINQSINPRQYSVLSKLLDLDEPLLTDKTLDFLTQAPVMEAFCRFVTQVECSAGIPASVNLRINHSNNHLNERLNGLGEPFTRSITPSNDNTPEQSTRQAIKQSYNVYRLLVHSPPSPALNHLITTHMALMWKLLCASFVQSSRLNNQSSSCQGYSNLFHVCGILSHFFQRFPHMSMDLLLSDQANDQSTNDPTNQSDNQSSEKSTFHNFLNAFDVLHESPVPQFLLLILAGPSDLPASQNFHYPVLTQDSEKRLREKRMKLIGRLRANHVLTRIMKTVMYLPQQDTHSNSQSINQSISQSINQSRSESSVDFLCQLLSAVSRCELLTSLFAHIANDNGLIDQALTGLSSRIVDYCADDQPDNQSNDQSLLPINQPILPSNNQSFLYTSSQRQSCSSLLLSLVESVATRELFLPVRSNNQPTSQANETAMTGTKKVPNPLFALKNKVVARLKNKVSMLSSVLTDSKSDSSTARLGLLRFKLFELIVRLIELEPTIVFEIPRAAWIVLLEWTFHQFAHQVFLQQCVSSMLTVLMRYPAMNQSDAKFAQYEEAWHWLLIDQKLLSQLCSSYHSHEMPLSPLKIGQSRSSSARPLDSTIIRLFACLRLTATLLPKTSFLVSHLALHGEYRQLQNEILREANLQAAVKGQPQNEAQYLAYMASRTGQTKQPINAGFVAGIEIGSTFAQQLGFVGDLVVLNPSNVQTVSQSTDKKKKKNRKKKKKTTSHAIDDADDTNEADVEQTGKQEEEHKVADSMVRARR